MKADVIRKKNRHPIAENLILKRLTYGVMIFSCVCLFTVWHRVSIEETLRKIGKLEKRLDELQKRNVELEVELTKLTDFKRINKIATSIHRYTYPKKIILSVPEKYTTLIKEN